MTDIEYQACRSLTEYARSRTCSLGGVGTGNVLRCRGRTFIVTAKHVADGFYELKRPQVIFRHNYKVPAQQLEYLSSTDDKLDIALIAVRDLNPEIISYGYSDLEFIDNFQTYNFDHANIQVFGFPSELQHKTERDLFYSWMCYLTTPCSDPPSNEDFLFCHYPMNSSVRESSTGVKVSLPPARGLSGAFVLKAPAYADHSSPIWTLAGTKVIAVQIEWNKKSYIKCSNIVHLRPMLDAAIANHLE